EARIMEVATVTQLKAPELLASFNVAYLRAAELVGLLEAQSILFERHASQVRAVVILDRAPVRLKEKGLATEKNPNGSADLRQAVLDSDDEYRQAMDAVGQINALLSLFKEKKKAIEMAYTSVKKILGETPRWHSY